MTSCASNRIEQVPAIVDGGRACGPSIYAACRRGLIKEAHEPHEGHDVSRTVALVKVSVILSQRVGSAFRILFPLIREILIGDTHLDVVCLASKDEKRLVLRFPSKA